MIRASIFVFTIASRVARGYGARVTSGSWRDCFAPLGAHPHDAGSSSTTEGFDVAKDVGLLLFLSFSFSPIFPSEPPLYCAIYDPHTYNASSARFLFSLVHLVTFLHEGAGCQSCATRDQATVADYVVCR